ncbi:MAG: peptidyl-prolyl cis-trans isomerase [Deltaproteobacteria bacterium]|nr:peptidyl-prolyl cis-trans isomerase [Deltaproteobacteria bacterium]
MSVKALGRFFKIVWLLLLMVLLYGLPLETQAFWFGAGEPLLKVNDSAYESSDFRIWWQEWREPESKLPKELTPFIEWVLLVQEARKMELEENREYRRKVEIFLKSRSLMMLKQEEVDNHLKEPAREVLWADYEKLYQPILELKILQVAEPAAAEEILDACVKGAEPKAAALAAGIIEPRFILRKGVRPHSVSEDFKPLFTASPEEGRFHLVAGGGGSFMVIEVVGKQVASDEDYEAQVEGLRKNYFRNLERKLNAALLDKLRQKYKPVIDEEAWAAIETLKAGDAALKKTVITIAELEIPAWQIVRLIENERKMFRDRQGQASMTIDNIKKLVLDNVLAQTLVGLEAHNRHYEKISPFKETYDFYCQRRLIKELENSVLWPQVVVNEADIKAEYERMVDHFSQSDEVEVAWVELADERLSQLITAELNQGRDFFKVMEPYFPQGVEYAREKEDRLRPDLRDIVSRLEPGQVSAPEKKGEKTFFVKLIRRLGGQHLPLTEVSEMLAGRMREERFVKARRELLETLKSRSQIVVKERTWRRLRQELQKEALNADKKSRKEGDAS